MDAEEAREFIQVWLDDWKYEDELIFLIYNNGDSLTVTCESEV